MRFRHSARLTAFALNATCAIVATALVGCDSTSRMREVSAECDEADFRAEQAFTMRDVAQQKYLAVQHAELERLRSAIEFAKPNTPRPNDWQSEILEFLDQAEAAIDDLQEVNQLDRQDVANAAMALHIYHDCHGAKH